MLQQVHLQPSPAVVSSAAYTCPQQVIINVNDIIYQSFRPRCLNSTVVFRHVRCKEMSDNERDGESYN
jgi:hypothetical protein